MHACRSTLEDPTPILGADETLGVVCFFRSNRIPGDERLLVFLAMFAEQLGAILLRRRGEERLRRSENLLASAQAIAHIGSWDLDLTGNVLTWSAELHRIFGVDPSRFKATYEGFVELVLPEDRERVGRIMQQAQVDLQPFAFEHRIIRPSGEIRVIHARGQVVVDRDGRASRMAGTGQDITERKRAEERLHEVRQAMEYAVEAIAKLSSDGRYLSLNPAYAAMFGYEPGELVGKPWMTTIQPADRDAVLQARERMRTLGRSEVESRRVRKDGSMLHTRAVMVRLADGTYYCFVTDISARKLAEQALAEHTAELARSNAELEQFAYVASHDLQEPLRMVSSFVQLLARRYEGKLDKEADEFIHYAVDGTQRMQGLIRDLLMYSRVGRHDGGPQTVSLNETLHTVLENLKAALDETGANVTVGDLPELVAEPTQLLQLFQNLISNALKFRGEEKPRIAVSARAADREWEFEVRDNGIGIDPQYAERIFGVFQRLHTHQEYPGTGIGLAICRKIVERQGGRIWVESQVGEGCVFRFTLPRPDASGHARAA